MQRRSVYVRDKQKIMRDATRYSEFLCNDDENLMVCLMILKVLIIEL